MNSNNRGGPRGPTRDPMDVGLGRHHRRAPSNNPFADMDSRTALFLALGAGMVLAALALVVVLMSSSPPPPKAQIAMTYGPVKVWAEGEVSRLKYVMAKVRNISAVEAQGVKVVLTVPGQQVNLSGPKTLAPGDEAEYKGSINVIVGAEDKVTVGMECANCAPLQ